jgi:hypothetical protein
LIGILPIIKLFNKMAKEKEKPKNLCAICGKREAVTFIERPGIDKNGPIPVCLRCESDILDEEDE